MNTTGDKIFDFGYLCKFYNKNLQFTNILPDNTL